MYDEDGGSSQDVLSDFEGEININSLWDKRFLVASVVESIFFKAKDQQLFENLVLSQAWVGLQSLSMKPAFPERAIDQ